jgi:hypothetical protein
MIFLNLCASCHFTTCVHDLMTRVVVLEINKAESLPVNGLPVSEDSSF